MSEENITPNSIEENIVSNPSVEKEKEPMSISEKILSRSQEIIANPEKTQTSATYEAINEYYRLKSKYENTYYENYIKPILNSKKSKREKRLEYSRLPKHACINCGRQVGTIFSNYFDNKLYFRKLIAKCGDLEDPCPLDIQINCGVREQMDKGINNGLKDIENIKLKIIKEKNNALFFNKSVVDKFEELTKQLKTTTSNTGYLIELNILRNNNPEEKVLLNKSIDEFGKGLLLPYKQLISQYMDNNDPLVINRAVELYVTEMVPKLKEIQAMKYDINAVEYNESGKWKLIQIPTSLENKEFSVEQDDSVLAFVKGVKKSKKSKKTMKLKDSTKTKKTKKVKLSDDFEIEDVEEEIILKDGVQDIPKLEEKQDITGVPNFDLPGGIKWDNPKYNQIWSNVPKVLKDVLRSDEEWLQEYMTNCVAARRAGKRCELILPSKTKMPPEVKIDNTYEPPIEVYDFGVEIINSMFNKFDKTYKDRLLTLYSEKNGVKNYNMLRDTITNLLEQKLMPGYVPGYY